MKSKSFSEFRRSLAATIDVVANDREPVLITRTGGKPAAVLMSVEDFASYEETSHLLRTPTNAERLTIAVRELRAGQGRKRRAVKENPT